MTYEIAGTVKVSTLQPAHGAACCSSRSTVRLSLIHIYTLAKTSGVAAYATDLVLLVIIDLVVPEQCLVTVAPEIVLGPDVLVLILRALLKWWHVVPMLPMLIPQVPGICTGDEQARNDDVDGKPAPGICSYVSMETFLNG